MIKNHGVILRKRRVWRIIIVNNFSIRKESITSLVNSTDSLGDFDRPQEKSSHLVTYIISEL
jgi:hypothetical protein